METRRRLAVLLAPPSLWLVLLFLAPLVLILLFSFRADTVGPGREVFSLEHFQAFATNPIYRNRLAESTGTAFETAVITVLLAYPLAFFLAFRAGPMRLTLLTILIVPAWTSYLLRLLAWKMMLGSNGALSTLLQSLNLVQGPLPMLLFSRGAVIFTLVYSWIPFVALPIFSTLERIDRRLLEASADLGCAPWETFLRVTLPLSVPGVTAGFFYVFIPTLGEYVTPLLMGGTYTMYGNLIQEQFKRALNWPLGAVLSLAMLVLVLIFTWLLDRLVPGALTEA